MAKFTRYRHRKARKNPSEPRRNPPTVQELAEFIGPGFAAFAATRFGTRVAATQIAKKKPTWGKHAGAIASVGAFLAAWFLAHRLKMLARFHTPIVVGAGIAAIQSLIQLYVPKLGWMVADATPELKQMPAQQPTPQLPPNLEYIDEDPTQYTYSDAYDAGRYAGSVAQTAQVASSAPAAPDDEMMDIDLDEGEPQSSMAGGW